MSKNLIIGQDDIVRVKVGDVGQYFHFIIAPFPTAKPAVNPKERPEQGCFWDQFQTNKPEAEERLAQQGGSAFLAQRFILKSNNEVQEKQNVGRGILAIILPTRGSLHETILLNLVRTHLTNNMAVRMHRHL